MNEMLGRCVILSPAVVRWKLITRRFPRWTDPLWWGLSPASCWYQSPVPRCACLCRHFHFHLLKCLVFSRLIFFNIFGFLFHFWHHFWNGGCHGFTGYEGIGTCWKSGANRSPPAGTRFSAHGGELGVPWRLAWRLVDLWWFRAKAPLHFGRPVSLRRVHDA